MIDQTSFTTRPWKGFPSTAHGSYMQDRHCDPEIQTLVHNVRTPFTGMVSVWTLEVELQIGL